MELLSTGAGSKSAQMLDEPDIIDLDYSSREGDVIPIDTISNYTVAEAFFCEVVMDGWL